MDTAATAPCALFSPDQIQQDTESVFKIMLLFDSLAMCSTGQLTNNMKNTVSNRYVIRLCKIKKQEQRKVFLV